MVTNRKTFILPAILLIFLYGFAPYIHADTHPALRCTYADISAAISSASPGDEVTVPLGSSVWSNTLTISKAITLRGAGIGKTVISGSVRYEMPDPSSASFFRLTGFTFNPGSLTITNMTRYYAGRIRIDHNSFTSSGATLTTEGNVFGVVDNNVFNNGNSWMIMGANSYTWGYITFKYGTADALYVEDNEINYSSAINSLYQDSGAGAVFVLRYNNYTFSCTGTSNVYWWDMHGNQGLQSNHSTMGAEIYGNRLISTTAGNIQIIDQRGGSALVYWNKAEGVKAAWYQTREECDDALNGNVPSIGPAGQPMHVSDSYYWNNRFGATLTTSHDIGNGGRGDCVPPTYTISLGVDVFDDNGNGVSYGPLASLPATCSVGDAYWATDQICTSVDNANVGRYPSAPISGTLYKCLATNTWTQYYTPYTYPHPLTQKGGSNPASGLRITTP